MSLIVNNYPIDKIIFSPICNAPTYIVTFIALKQKAEKQISSPKFQCRWYFCSYFYNTIGAFITSTSIAIILKSIEHYIHSFLSHCFSSLARRIFISCLTKALIPVIRQRYVQMYMHTSYLLIHVSCKPPSFASTQ